MRGYYEISELTWGQDKELTRLIIRLSERAGEEDITLNDLPPLLIKQDLLAEFWGIVLQPQYWNPLYWWSRIKMLPKVVTGKRSLRAVEVDHLTNSEMARMFEDFFLKNRSFLTKLKNFGDAFSLIAKVLTEDSGNGSPAKASGQKTRNRSKSS